MSKKHAERLIVQKSSTSYHLATSKEVGVIPLKDIESLSIFLPNEVKAPSIVHYVTSKIFRIFLRASRAKDWLQENKPLKNEYLIMPDTSLMPEIESRLYSLPFTVHESENILMTGDNWTVPNCSTGAMCCLLAAWIGHHTVCMLGFDETPPQNEFERALFERDFKVYEQLGRHGVNLCRLTSWYGIVFSEVSTDCCSISSTGRGEDLLLPSWSSTMLSYGFRETLRETTDFFGCHPECNGNRSANLPSSVLRFACLSYRFCVWLRASILRVGTLSKDRPEDHVKDVTFLVGDVISNPSRPCLLHQIFVLLK